MKRKYSIIGRGAAALLLCMALPAMAGDQVSVQDFNALKSVVEQLSDQVHGLSESNIVAQQVHEQDMQQIQDLRVKLAETQKTAADADQKSTLAVQIQSEPASRPPLDEATVNHNFQMLGDAEFQYVNSDHENGAFELADFAPIFLYRGGDNILFEAGFDTTLGNNAPNSGGCIYYVTTALLLEGDYEFINSSDPTQPSNQLILQISYGF